MSRTLAARALCAGLLALSSPVLADEPLTLRAMRDEIERQAKGLTLPGVEKPYYLELSTINTRSINVEAAYGALLRSQAGHYRYLQAGVRVGSAEFDQSNYGISGLGGQLYGIAYEDDYDLLRHEIWVAADESYKNAVELLAYKRSELGTRLEKPDQPSFSAAPALVKVADKAPSLPSDWSAWENAARGASAVFLRYPDILDSRVEIAAWVDERYLVTTEGSSIYTPRLLIRVLLEAETRGQDGTKLREAIPFYVREVGQVPSRAELEKRAAALADSLMARRAAKAIEEDYIGPILFEGEAAGQVLRKILADRFSSTPPPGLAGAKTGPTGRADFGSKLGRKVLPKFLSVEDDPTISTLGGVPLLGAYEADEEGVAAQKVSLVEKGILRGMLSSRTPSKAGPSSNGHGRGALGTPPKGRPGNLLVRADKGLSSKELRKRAAALAKEAGLPYAIVVSRLETPGSYDTEANLAVNELPAPLVASRIYPDGKEEALSGFSLSEVDLRSLQRVVAAGSEASVYSYLASGDSGGYSGFLANEQPLFTIPTSIATPALLFEEVEARKQQNDPPKPPILPNPLFEKPSY
jgi:predicted Zn-dependent protease